MYHVFTKDLMTGRWQMLLGFGHAEDARAAVCDFADQFLEDYGHLPREGQDFLLVQDVHIAGLNADMHEMQQRAREAA